MLTNAGIVYFKKKQFKSLKDYKENEFKPLQNFVVRIPQNEKNVKYPFTVEFLKTGKNGKLAVEKKWLLDCS